MAARITNILPIVSEVQGATLTTSIAVVGIRVDVDLDDEGRRIAGLYFSFADNPTLEAEYNTGTAYTVLEGLVETALAAWPDDEDATTGHQSYLQQTESYPVP